MKLHSDVRCRSVAGEGIIVCQEQAEVLVVNGVGARVVELVQRETKLEAIVADICREFAVDDSVARRDVCAFLDELEQAGVLEQSSD